MNEKILEYTESLKALYSTTRFSFRVTLKCEVAYFLPITKLNVLVERSESKEFIVGAVYSYEEIAKAIYECNYSF